MKNNSFEILAKALLTCNKKQHINLVVNSDNKIITENFEDDALLGIRTTYYKTPESFEIQRSLIIKENKNN